MSGYYKRKRGPFGGGAGGTGGYTKKRKRRSSPKGVVPGFTRRVGYYGRMSGQGGTEWKFFDTDFTEGPIGINGTLLSSMNLIPQGVNESERNGRKCTIKSIQWRWEIRLGTQNNVSNPPVADTIRMIMYVDRQTNGTAAVPTDILDTDDYQSFRNLQNMTRFHIILDKLVVLNYQTLTESGMGNFNASEIHKDGILYKTCNIPIEFLGSTGGITELATNNIGILLLSRNGLAGNINSTLRVRFSDY